MTRRERHTHNEQFCKSWVEVQNSTVVLLFGSSAKLKFSASISQPSQSCQNVMRHCKMTKYLTIIYFFISFLFLNCTRKLSYKCGLFNSSTSSLRPKIDSKILKFERTAIADTTMAFINGTIQCKDSLNGNVTQHLLEYISISVSEQTTRKTYGNSTDINGKYKFFMRPSTYDLKVQMVNYNTLIIRNIKVGSGDVIEFNAQLGQSDITSDSTVYLFQADRTLKIIPNQTRQIKRKL